MRFATKPLTNRLPVPRPSGARFSGARRSRSGFALIAAIGVLAVLMILVFTANSTVQYNITRTKLRMDSRELIAVAEAAARSALDSWASPRSETAIVEVPVGDYRCHVVLEPLDGGEEIYQEQGLRYRAGDSRAEVSVGTAKRGMRAVWILSGESASKRVILLERGALVE